MTIITPLLFGLGLTAGNFLYQAFGSLDWGVAAERSFFQIAALVLFYLLVINE